MFLTGERYQLLEDIFSEKTGKGKHYIPVGVNILTLKQIKESQTRYGQPMYVFSFYKKPVASNKRLTKINFKYINCYHIVGVGDEDWRNMWYKPLTSTMSKEQILWFKRYVHKEFKAVVRQKENVMKEDNQILDKSVYYMDCEIVSVHKKDEDVQLSNDDYFNLFEYDKNRQG